MLHLSADWALTEAGFVPNLRLTIQDGIITAIGPAGEPAEHLPGLLLPGMPNLHSHGFQRVFAGLGNGDNFWSWREAMYRAAALMTPELYVPVWSWLGKELLKGGYTAVAEFHYLQHKESGVRYTPPSAMADAVVEGARRSGIGITILAGVYETAGFDGAPLEDAQRRFGNGVDAALATVQTLQAAGTNAGLALHSLRAVPESSIRAASGGHYPIHIHVAEQTAEVEACRAARHAPPIAWLLDNAPVDKRWCLVHATHATTDEIRAAAHRCAVVGLCPTTEADLGDGVFDFPALQDLGGAFGIGSDSQVCLDAISELRLLEYGQRLRLLRRLVAGRGSHIGAALWRDAASGGAQACGIAAGEITVGQRADFVVLDRTPEAQDAAPEDALDAAIFGSVRNPVRDVMVGGRFVVRNGVHQDEARIDAAYRLALKALNG